MYQVCILMFLVIDGRSGCTYRAGSLQFAPKFKEVYEVEIYQQKNLELLQEQILEAAVQGVDIIVLPESTLFLPGYSYLYPGSPVSFAEQRKIMAYYGEEFLNNGTIPCEDPVSYVSPLRVLSCAARDAEVMVVASLVHLVKCSGQSGCPDDGQWQYNTAVVLNNEGRLVGVHHKQHIFGESPVIDQAKDDQPPLSVWMPVQQEDESCPSFVKIGVLICYEIMYSTPWNTTSLEAAGVRDIVVPMAWGDDPPADFAAMYAQGYSVIHGINVISSNDGSTPLHGNGGGIFSKGEVLTYGYNSTGDIDVLLIADVPILGGDVRRASKNVPQSNREYSRVRRRRRDLDQGSATLANLRDRTSQVQQQCVIGAVEGDCVVVSAAREGNILLRVVSSDLDLECTAEFRALGGEFLALVALSEVKTPPYTLDPYTLKSCVLLPSKEDGTWGFV